MPIHEKEQSTSKPTESASRSDLVIRNGFPALRLEDGSPNIQDHEAIPRHPIWAAETIGLPVSQLRTDAEAVFTARTRDDDAAYSAGITYFLPCHVTPRCALEGLVQTIFRAHTDAISSTFDANISGAEWWTLVMDDDEEEEGKAKEDADDDDKDGDDDDEVGMHFDADYGLEAQAPGLLLHPRLATVTYLSDFGAPTVIWDRKSPPPGNVEDMEGAVKRAWLSHPKIGKHIAFDGRFLHGAPTVFFPAKKLEPEDRPAKRIKQDTRRITLLVNIWLNHCPVDAEPLETEIIEQLVTPWDSKQANADGYRAFSWAPGASFDKVPETIVRTTLKVADKADDEAGSEEFVVCERIVDAKYRSTMDALHAASNSGDLVEVCFEEGAFYLSVGRKVEEETDNSDADKSDTER